jgi:heme A synthase
MKKRYWFKNKIMFFLLFVAAVLLFGAVVMGLWNAILPEVIGVKTISFVQALGILLLSKILFGGFRGGWGGGYRRGRWMEMQQKMAAMTPEEKEKFQAEWKNRCGNRWKMNTATNTPDTAVE